MVAPHEALTDFWQRAFTADLVRRFASGPSLTDPRGPMPEADQQRVNNLWQGLLAQLVSRYAALDNDRLDDLVEEIEEQTGAWHSFWEPVQQTMQQALADTGIRGAIAICDLLGPINRCDRAGQFAAAPASLSAQRHAGH